MHKLLAPKWESRGKNTRQIIRKLLIFECTRWNASNFAQIEMSNTMKVADWFCSRANWKNTVAHAEPPRMNATNRENWQMLGHFIANQAASSTLTWSNVFNHAKNSRTSNWTQSQGQCIWTHQCSLVCQRRANSRSFYEEEQRSLSARNYECWCASRWNAHLLKLAKKRQKNKSRHGSFFFRFLWI